MNDSAEIIVYYDNDSVAGINDTTNDLNLKAIVARIHQN